MISHPIRVLLVEDEANDALIVKALLKSGGEAFSCESVASLGAALERLSSPDIDVVLLDFGLPDSSGLDTFKRLHAGAPGVAIIPLTGSGDEELALAAIQLGAQDYLFKGAVNYQLLTRTIRYAHERKRNEEALRQARDELEKRVAERTAELQDLYQAERRARETAEALSAANLAITQSLDLNEVLSAMLDCLQRLVPYDSASVLLCSGETQFSVCVARGYEQWGDGSPVRRIVFDAADHPHLGRVLREGASVLIPDTALEEGWDRNLGGGSVIRNWLGVPLKARGRVIGLYSIDKNEPGFFTPEHQRLAEMLTVQAAVAIENAQLFADMHASKERLRALSHRLVEVQEAERRLIARELHDEVGQILTGLKLLLGTVSRLPTEKAGEGLARADALLDELMGRLRSLSLDLRPAMLDDLGLLHALHWHIDRYTQQTGITVNLSPSGVEGRRFAPAVETAAYRIIQEALTNIARHAGVREASVHLWASEEMLTVQIEDRGRGFDPEAASMAGTSNGLAGMRERAELLGGHLTIDSVKGSGTSLAADLPLNFNGVEGEGYDDDRPGR